MKSIKDYDRLVCTAVRNDPLGFIDGLLESAEAARSGNEKPQNFELVLREAACVIANLMDRLGIPERRTITND